MFVILFLADLRIPCIDTDSRRYFAEHTCKYADIKREPERVPHQNSTRE